MSVTYRCKMCGGDVECNQGETVGTCDSCGTKQTLPKTGDDNLSNLFNRANNLRLKCEFDRAEKLYEKIVETDDSEAEAHWGLVLCRYGIEYVEDPKTFKRIPTCHRTLYEAITSDPDYQSAIDYSDAVQQSIYESEAKAIDKIQKDILAVVKNEKPFDVFICYKETDETGKRTQDSVIANDIYYQLTQEGYKVFYSAITLEDKLGQEYEPYIFSALSSAKVMLVLGTKSEYFNAVWVKNEWSRFMRLMKSDKNKLLIPCYRDMDAYDLPDEFAHLQSQDMSKIGFVIDLMRGIQKILKPQQTPTETAVAVTQPKVIVQSDSGNTGNVEALTKRAFMCLEDGDFSKADDLLEQALNNNPEYGMAYLGKLMVEFKLNNKESLKYLKESFGLNKYFKRAMQYGDEALKNQLNLYLEESKEQQRLTILYNQFCSELQKANNEIDYQNVANKFKQISFFKDSKKFERICLERVDQIISEKEKLYEKSISDLSIVQTIQDCIKIKEIFESLNSFKNSKNYIEECDKKIEELEKEERYKDAIFQLDTAKTTKDCLKIKSIFVFFDNFMDSIKYVKKCDEKIEEIENNIFNEIISNMVTCPAGSFIIGSYEGFLGLFGGELGRNIDENQHKVIISRDFKIGKYLVTQRLYESIMEKNPSHFKSDNKPVEQVNWNDAKEFCKKLNDKFASKLPSGYRFDLPTEAQWEYACRANTITSLNNGKDLTSKTICNNLDEIAWYECNSGNQTHQAGLKKPNSWGLYDMQGNVWEWCIDWYGDYSTGEVTDPVKEDTGSFRIIRGGSWFNTAQCCRSANRNKALPDIRDYRIGFRLALVPVYK